MLRFKEILNKLYFNLFSKYLFFHSIFDLLVEELQLIFANDPFYSTWYWTKIEKWGTILKIKFSVSDELLI